MHQDIIAFDVHISKEGNPQAGLQTNADEPGTCQDLHNPHGLNLHGLAESHETSIDISWIHVLVAD